jgi:hypothetical protein
MGVMLIASALCAENAAPPSKPALDYPENLRVFRRKALFTDGRFAPDIAFTLRTCPKCSKPYVFGNFPRLSRLPFASLAEVDAAVQAAAGKPAPSSLMFSPGQNRMVARACPNCGEPEPKGARADRALFCHVLPETGDDLEIEYTVRGEKILSRTYWRLPHTPLPAGPYADPSPDALAALSWGAAEEKKLADGSEDAFRKAFGVYFSLRGVWNEVMAGYWERSEPFYREVSPGLYFIFRPKNMDVPSFGEFTGKKLMPDKKDGAFDRLESPLTLIEGRRYEFGTPFDWLKADTKALTDGTAEMFVGVDYEHLRHAALTVAGSRRMDLVFDQEDGKPALTATLSNGEFTTKLNLFPLCHDVAVAGVSLEHACALMLTPPIYALDGAAKFYRKIVAARPGCRVTIKDGSTLELEDRLHQKRTVNALALADSFDFENEYLFGLYITAKLPWDEANQAFGPEKPASEFSALGLPAFVEKRLRPRDFLALRGQPGALYERRVDAGGKDYDVCYTWECPASLTYIDPTKEPFKAYTLELARARYEPTAGVLPTYYVAKDSLFFPGDRRKRLSDCRATLVVGPDLVSVACDLSRAWALALSLAKMEEAEDLRLYAPSANGVILAPRALTDDELALARSRLKTILDENKVDPGTQLDLHFDLPQAPPRGKVLRRGR